VLQQGGGGEKERLPCVTTGALTFFLEKVRSVLSEIKTWMSSMSRKIGPVGLIALCLGYVLNDLVGTVLGPTDYEVVRELVRDTQFQSAVTEISEDVVSSTVSDNHFFFSQNNNFRNAVSDIAAGALEEAFKTYEFEEMVKSSISGNCNVSGQLDSDGESVNGQVYC